jgi:hypothetical protein
MTEQPKTLPRPAQIGPQCYPYSVSTPLIPVTNSKGQLEYFRSVPRDLLRHLGVPYQEGTTNVKF